MIFIQCDIHSVALFELAKVFLDAEIVADDASLFTLEESHSCYPVSCVPPIFYILV
jgi:hypothetical protein